VKENHSDTGATLWRWESRNSTRQPTRSAECLRGDRRRSLHLIGDFSEKRHPAIRFHHTRRDTDEVASRCQIDHANAGGHH